MPIPYERMHAILILNPFNSNLIWLTSYFSVQKLTWEEHEDYNIITIVLIAEDPPWIPPSPEFIVQEQNMFDYRGLFINPTTPEREQLFSNSVTLYVYDTADVTNIENIDTVLKSIVN